MQNGGGQRTPPDERTEAVRQLLEKEQTVEQIVSRFNLISAQVVYGWIGRYIEEILLSDTPKEPEIDDKELTLSEALKAKSRMMLRLSSMTLPHAFARVLLTEQIYRAWSILANHPYHRV